MAAMKPDPIPRSTIPKVRDKMPGQHALKVAKHIADTLRAQGATKVLLFGSLATGDYDPEYSDIDIYREGIPQAEIIHAEVVATWETNMEDDTGRRRVDLVHWHSSNKELKRRILATGVPI